MLVDSHASVAADALSSIFKGIWRISLWLYNFITLIQPPKALSSFSTLPLNWELYFEFDIYISLPSYFSEEYINTLQFWYLFLYRRHRICLWSYDTAILARFWAATFKIKPEYQIKTIMRYKQFLLYFPNNLKFQVFIYVNIFKLFLMIDSTWARTKYCQYMVANM